MTPSTTPRRAAAIAVALLGVLCVLGPAHASGRLTADTGSGPQPVSTARFGVVPTTLATTPPPGPLVLTFAALLAPPPQYFDAVNTGTVDLVGASYAASLTSLLPLGSSTLTLTGCVGAAWNQLTGSCSGTTVALGSWTSASAAPVASSAAPSAPGARLSVKAALSAGSLGGSTVATVSVSVSSGPTRQIRAARSVSS